MNYITLNNGEKMPQLGFGVYQIPNEETEEAVYQAIVAGYRLIDTAISYGNEAEVGAGVARAIAEGLVSREDLFITTKLFVNNVFNQETAATAIDESMTKLGLTYIDLVLLHQPYGDTYGAWRALATAQANGRVKSIGISNFDAAQMIEFTRMNDVKITPQINQIEINPWNQRKSDLAWHEKYHVQAEAWAPFAEGRHDLFTNPVLSEIAEKHQKSVGQVVLRWLMQRGVVALAKSTKPERMRENLNIFDFELADTEMDKIAELDMKESAFFDHHDPKIVEWFLDRIETK
ncbi:aldo/keto reductase [Weissella cibaria]|uniref:aldo/keto reductase n=1 Tax=Weissella cibaria TaxID=137591 RepID=UPI0011906E7F|nr:aldo/keto reductase [Weissella cibaria]MCA1354862.1 aldo/keto reductase [Weissella cibaria]MCT8401843.1 aldo/keto reductase [Weissella cibaria]MDQ2125197.1 aldo/keto reductase [Weissella cibaria]MDQ2158112.1 aldo/keto reductase [Weissella cibaria]TVV32501.1 aldo/keto reductase [Weissella cibaria]